MEEKATIAIRFDNKVVLKLPQILICCLNPTFSFFVPFYKIPPGHCDKLHFCGDDRRPLAWRRLVDGVVIGVDFLARN
jgi:hypothetical protein